MKTGCVTEKSKMTVQLATAECVVESNAPAARAIGNGKPKSILFITGVV